MEFRASTFAILCLLLGCCVGTPVQGSAEREGTPVQVTLEKPEVYNGSSKLLNAEDIAVKTARSAKKCPDNSCFWPKNSAGIVNVPYILASYSEKDATAIREAMKEYISMTCIRFVPRKRESDFLSISPRDGCFAYMGRKGGSQIVSLDHNCMTKGKIQHELNHALGFHHEQSRSDRDDYVRILLQYVDKVNQLNFKKEATNNLGLEYDYSSVMHYSLDAYTNKNGEATILPTRKITVHIGQRKGMSSLDVAKINRLYKCDICSTVNSFGFGFMNSTNYPSLYPNNVNCSYLMRSTGYKILLTFNSFDIELSEGCQNDYITIYDGITKDAPILLNKACGRGIMPPMLSSSDAMLMEFITNDNVTASGFSAYFQNVVCGHIYTNQSGTVTSENYPANYPPKLECSYYLWAPAGSKISLKFNDFDLEPMPGDCGLVYILIYNGPTTKSPLIGRYCGTGPVPNIVSSSNELLITFSSESMNQRKGFSASYTRVSA